MKNKFAPIFCDTCQNIVVRKPIKNKRGTTLFHICPICGVQLPLSYHPHGKERVQKTTPYRADIDYHGTIIN